MRGSLSAGARVCVRLGTLRMNNSDHRERLKELLRRKSIVRGKFTLASGKTSDYYIDCKLTTLDPEGAVLVGHSVLDLLEAEGIHAEAIGGPPIGAHPIVTAVAAVSHLRGKPLPAFLIRKEAKSHGLEKQIEGPVKAGARVVIMDDVCTSGGSTEQAIDAARNAGLEIIAVMSLVDREQGGSEKLRQKYRYLRIFTAGEILEGIVPGEEKSSSAAADSASR
jgi:orotate phosphoribosyltransferase